MLRARPIGVSDAVGISLGNASIPHVCIRKKDRSVSCMRAERGSLPPTIDGLTDGSGGKAGCWGGGFSGVSAASTQSPDLEGAKDVATGSAFACAIDASGKVVNVVGDKGRPPDRPAKHVELGVYHGCSIDTGGSVFCWGDDRFGQLGGGEPGVKGVRDAIGLAVGAWHSCALEKSGRVLCWGRNERGQLGDGTTTTRAIARPVKQAERP